MGTLHVMNGDVANCEYTQLDALLVDYVRIHVHVVHDVQRILCTMVEPPSNRKKKEKRTHARLVMYCLTKMMSDYRV